MCYMLYNGTEEDGDEAPVGWVRDYLYDHESRAFGSDEKAIADFLSQYGGQRFLPTAFGEETDPPIYDLTVANGYNGLAAYAFTVDRDFSAETAEERELYVQFYNFKDHKTYIPVKVAGEIELYDINIPDRHKSGYEIYETTEAVEVAQPKLIRSGGSTWLFWREDQDGLRYLNISELLNAKVSDDDYSDYEGRSEKEIGEIAASNVRYALRDDGTLDPAYTLNVQKVDFGSYTTNGDLNVTDYQIITDADDNLYVVWTDTTLDRVYSEALDEYVEKTSVEIYAAARIREAELAETNGEGTTQPVRWSKPYRLTRDSMYHDGVEWALNGGVMNGVGGDLFRPDGATTRAMLVTMLWRMERMPQVRYDLRFADVPEGAWFAEAIRWAVSAGIVSGYDASSFGPDDGVTREQLAAILYRYASPRRETASSGEEDLRNRFGDAAQISPWAPDAMGWAVGEGLIRGTGDGNLSPGSHASRAQVAAVLARFSS